MSLHDRHAPCRSIFYSPYKATNIIDFWRRWHMTLSRFLRDYLYIPLGGKRSDRFDATSICLQPWQLGGSGTERVGRSSPGVLCMGSI